MAVNTERRRNSALATRRLPWFRRFAPLPRGAIGAGSRAQAVLVYAGSWDQAGPLFVLAGGVFVAGAEAGAVFVPGAGAGTVFRPGAGAGVALPEEP